MSNDWIPTIAVNDLIFWLIKYNDLVTLPVQKTPMMTPGCLICFEMEGDEVPEVEKFYCYATITEVSKYRRIGKTASESDMVLIRFRREEILADIYVA